MIPSNSITPNESSPNQWEPLDSSVSPSPTGRLGSRTARPWTTEDNSLLLRLTSTTLTWKKIAKKFPGKKMHWLQRKLNQLRSEDSTIKVVRKKREDEWSKAEDAVICTKQSQSSIFEEEVWRDISDLLPKRTKLAAFQRWHQLLKLDRQKAQRLRQEHLWEQIEGRIPRGVVTSPQAAGASSSPLPIGSNGEGSVSEIPADVAGASFSAGKRKRPPSEEERTSLSGDEKTIDDLFFRDGLWEESDDFFELPVHDQLPDPPNNGEWFDEFSII